MNAGEEVFLCPNSEALVFCGAVPLCLVDDLNPLAWAFLANCANGGQSEGPCFPTIVLRSMTCHEASKLMGEVRDGGN